MEEINSFIFYRSFYEALKDLRPLTRQKIIDGICAFVFENKEPSFSGIENVIWLLIKPQIEANQKKYLDGIKGGRPTKKTTGYQNEKPLVIEKDENKKTTGYQNKKPNVNDNDNVNDNVKENVNEKENENDNENEKENGKAKKQRLTHTHGQFNHVRLTDDEYERLKKDFPFYQELIDHLDEYIEIKGAKYKNHNLVLRGWVLKWYKENHIDYKIKMKERQTSSYDDDEDDVFDFSDDEIEDMLSRLGD